MADAVLQGRLRFFFGLLTCVALLTLYVFSSYLLTLLVAAAFATIFHPLYVRLLRSLKIQWLATGLTMLVAGLIVCVPLVWIITQVSISASALYAELVHGTTPHFLQSVQQYVSQILPDAEINIQSLLIQLLQWLSANAGFLVTVTVNTMIHFVIGCFAFYIFIRDGDTFIDWIVWNTPLPPKDTVALLARMRATIASIIQGNLFVCVAQGIVTAIAMTFFGVPQPVLWGLLTVFVAIAPGVGPSIVILPAGLYIFLNGSLLPAASFVIVAMTCVWFIANFIGPALVSHGVKIHELWIIVSVIGGITTMGPRGFIVGPMAVSVLSAMFDMTPHVLGEKVRRQPQRS